MWGRGPVSRSPHVAAGRVRLPAGCWPEASLSSWPHGLSKVQLTMWQPLPLLQESVRKMNSTGLCNLMVTSHDFGHILFVGSKMLGSALLKGRGLHEDVIARRWDPSQRGVETITEVCGARQKQAREPEDLGGGEGGGTGTGRLRRRD